MPIKPENAHRYPPNWKEIRATVLERAGHCCEGSPLYPDCRVPNGAHRVNSTDQWSIDVDAAIAMCALGEVPTRIVLTVGHLDHTPENCAPDNLRAWCQRCHLAYDHEHHMRNAAATRRSRKAAGDLFEEQS